MAHTEAPKRVWRGKPTPRIRLEVYRRAGFQCVGCALKFPPPDGYDGRTALACEIWSPKKRRNVLRVLELDHIKPYLHGGRFRVTNLQALCSGCNAIKGASI